MSRPWDIKGEFEEAPTFVDVPEASDAIPIEVEDDPTTVSRCTECGNRCILGGPIVPDPKAMAHASPYQCARGGEDEDRWLWCVGQPGAWKFTRYLRR